MIRKINDECDKVTRKSQDVMVLQITEVDEITSSGIGIAQQWYSYE